MAKGAKWIFGGQQPPQSVASASTSMKSEKQSSSSEPTTADAKKFGLENFGNTCYANSVIQALYFCAPFRQLVVQANDNLVLPPIPMQSPPSPVNGASPSTTAKSLASSASRYKPDRKPSYTTPPTPSHSSTNVASPFDSSSAAGAPSTSSYTSIHSHPSPAPTTAPSIPLKPPIPTASIPIPLHPTTLFSALRSLYVHISTHPSERGTVAPRAFIEKLKEVNEIFRSTTMHQDAHEFLNFLLNKIVEEIEDEKRVAQQLKEKEAMVHGDDLSSSIATLSPTIVTTTSTSNSGTSPQDATLVHKLFEGVLTSETRCLTCETISSRDESFLDLSIDIEQNSSVTACLRQFSASEMLCQKNKFFCDSCCDLQEAEKRMKIKRLPNVLALHLKRFKYQDDLQRYVKLAYRVAFPFELRLFNTVDDAEDADRLYELFGIVVHIGNGPHHGHYISIVKTLGTWLVFDDVNVSPIAETDIPKYFGDPAGSSSSNSGSAYVLYYQAKDIDLVSLGLKEPDLEPPPILVGQDGVTLNGLGVSLAGGTGSGGSLEETPAVPPGLSPEGLPSGSAIVDQSNEPSAPPPPTLQVDITGGSSEDVPSDVASSVSPPKSLMGGIMGTMGMRRTGSHSGHTHKPSRGSISDNRALERPARPFSGASTDEHPAAGADGYESAKKEDSEREKGVKEPGKKASWFTKRKSFRLGDKDKDKERSGHGASASEYTPHSNGHDFASSSGNWFKTSGHHGKSRLPPEPVSFFDIGHHDHRNGHDHNHDEPQSGNSRNDSPAEPNGTDPKSFKVIRGKTSNGTGSSLAMTELNGDATNGYESGVSTSSSHTSASRPLPPPITSSRSMDPHLTNGTESRLLRPLPLIPSKTPDHKKSLSSLPNVKPDMRGLPPPPRPSTAGNHSSSRTSQPPVPSPTLPSQYLKHSRQLSNGINPEVPHIRENPSKGKGRDDGHVFESEERSQTSAALDKANTTQVMSSPEGALASSLTVGSGSSSASSNFKRATRKLSLTAPMLFGKKDKDRDERHREKALRDREKAFDPTFPVVSPRF